MVNDGLFVVGSCAVISGLYWWFPPSALVFTGLVMISLAVIRHINGGATRGKTS